jgi:hypothetical protein
MRRVETVTENLNTLMDYPAPQPKSQNPANISQMNYSANQPRLEGPLDQQPSSKKRSLEAVYSQPSQPYTTYYIHQQNLMHLNQQHHSFPVGIENNQGTSGGTLKGSSFPLKPT